MIRRDCLRLAGGAGLTFLGEVLRQRPVCAESDAAGRPGFGKAKSVLLVIANGGQSQLESWDPKPDAPAEVRGEFGAIQTAVPGTLLSDRLPRLAKLADRFSIVRTISHEDLDHGSALYLSLTGEYHQRLSSNPPPRPVDQPFVGSVLKRVRPTDRFPHTSVLINGPGLVPWEPGPGQFGGFLGKDFDPMIVGDVSTDRPPVPGLTPIDALDSARRSERAALLTSLEDSGASVATSYSSRMFDMQALYRQAFEMLDRPEARDAFSLDQEPAALRERYGRHRPGQACLLARRLVEAGVPLVTVMWNHSNRGQDRYDDPEEFGWDTHNDIFQVMGRHLLPKFDQSFSALLEDLDSRGLLEETLVVCLGEFGRAPLVALEPRFAGATPGRKHWAATYSVVFAGAGVTHGSVVGQSDRHAAFPATTKFAPWDVTATIFHALGIDPAGHYRDLTSRPYLISKGRPITQLYS
ncbi:DUF1501 domain-containing protein [bacterium]|nr:DUF1501 domain-containing protein [bacterium]